MAKNPPSLIEEILFGSADKKESRRISVLLKQKQIRKIAPRIYTSNLNGEPANIIKNNWFKILSHLYPNAVLSYRSAIENQITPSGHIFLSYSYTGKTVLPGLTVHLLKGPERIEGDPVFWQNLFVAQEARAFLENMQQARKKGDESKVLTKAEIEGKLETIVKVRGEQGLNNLRDKAREVSQKLNMHSEFSSLNGIISGLLNTGQIANLKSPLAIARAIGEPMDANRVELFRLLYESLADQNFPKYEVPNNAIVYKTFAFFESYFSNFIEGTRFTVDEANNIINSNTPMPSRNEDSHDILGTYRLVANNDEMAICPQTKDQLLALLRNRHRVLMQARISMKPGEFKERNNRAGNTEFVDWRLVNGTLSKGFEWYQLLKDPFAKAAYMMFVVSEVHPFDDGNGRIARVMMNAELSSKGLSKIIIPTVYREDYILALRKLTRKQAPDAYVRMLLRAYEFSSLLAQNNIGDMEAYLIRCEAFEEPSQGRLRMPMI